MSTKRPHSSLAGRLAYQLYYQPRRELTELWRRGLVTTWQEERGRRQMEAASWELPQVPVRPNCPAADVYFLTGAKHFYQTAFCAWSLAAHIRDLNIRPVIYDDGTLGADHVTLFARLFPEAKVVRIAESESHLDQHLPRTRFPRLRGHRDVKPLLLKLCDIYSGGAGFRLFLDSDMLFFQRPAFLEDWLRTPQGSCYMVDIHTAYGYPKAFLDELAGTVVPEKINIGVMGMDGRRIDWDRVERRITRMLDEHGPHYNITQALCALEMTAQPPVLAAPAADYLVLPDAEECLKPTAILHHYVADSKSGYFRHGWRHALERSNKSLEVGSPP